MNDESMLVVIDHDHFRPHRPEVTNVIAILVWRVIGLKTGVHFS
jgi:hypothetical protein